MEWREGDRGLRGANGCIVNYITSRHTQLYVHIHLQSNYLFDTQPERCCIHTSISSIFQIA